MLHCEIVANGIPPSEWHEHDDRCEAPHCMSKVQATTDGEGWRHFLFKPRNDSGIGKHETSHAILTPGTELTINFQSLKISKHAIPCNSHRESRSHIQRMSNISNDHPKILGVASHKTVHQGAECPTFQNGKYWYIIKSNCRRNQVLTAIDIHHNAQLQTMRSSMS